jgi:hypothetical protein
VLAHERHFREAARRAGPESVDRAIRGDAVHPRGERRIAPEYTSSKVIGRDVSKPNTALSTGLPAIQ